MSFGNPFATGQPRGGNVQGLGHSGFEVSLNYVAGLPDPNIVAHSSLKLWFKSLLKRDDTTKERALHEFAQFATRENAAALGDDLVLITWVQLYPKLSLSESKTVRLLAHQLQTQLIAVLQKSYVRYLKDTMPVLLSGVYDLDASVANSTHKNIATAFQNDQSKINNLWVIFQNEILNFADQALNKETVDSLSDDRVVPRDEAELKYLRLINASISMVAHLVQVGYKLHPEKMDKNIDAYHAFFTHENLWHYLLVNSNANHQRIYKTLLQLINAVIHLQPELFTEKAWKLMSKRLLKSLTFVKKVDQKSTSAVLYSSMVLPILSTLNNLNQKNPEFFQYDKSHKERLTEFLAIGSLNSDPAYYQKLILFLTTASTVFSTEDVDTLEKILHKDFQTEVSKNSKLRAGAQFIIKSLTAYLEVLFKFDGIDKASSIVDEVVEIESSVSKQLVEPLSKYISKDIISQKLVEWSTKDTGNITTLLYIATKTSTSLEPALASSFDDLRSRSEEDEEGKTFINHHAFTIFDYVVKNNLTDYTTQVEEFLDELPTFITPLITEVPIEILKDYSNSTLYNKDILVDIFDSFVIKLEFIGLKKLILAKFDSFGHRDELLAASEELQTTLHEETSSYDFENDELFRAHLISNDSAISLWDLAKEKGKETEYISYFLKHNSGNEELCTYLFTETSVMEDLLWRDSTELHTEVISLLSNDVVREKYISLLQKTVSQEGSTPEIISKVSKALEKYPSLSHELTSFDFTSQFREAYGQTIDSRLSIGNPLECNVYLLSVEEGSFQFDALVSLIRYAVFIYTLEVDVSNELLHYFCIISEVADDYEFLNDGTHPSLPDVAAFQASLKQKILSKFEDSYTSLVSQIMTKSYTTLSEFAPTEDEVLTFYKCRLVKKVLDNAQATESSSKILELDLDKYTRQEIRSTAPSELLMFCTVISTLSQFLGDVKYERVKNLVGSELIGMRASEICSRGLKKLTVLINFMNFHHDEDELPLQAQRFNMIVNDLAKWLDSEVAYEPEFGVVRIQLLHLLQVWNTSKFDKTEGFKELTTRVVQDSTGLVSLDEGEHLLELKYWTLKLYTTLKKNGDVLESNVAKDTENEILESYVNDRTPTVNQPVIIYDEMLSRLLEKMPSSKFQPHEEALFAKYATTAEFAMKRPLLNILKKLIWTKQQDLVIEFEFAKDGDDMSQYNIPQNLIDMVLKVPKFHGLSSVEDDKKLVDYLWSWKLVLFNFKDITLKLRQTYIQQLQGENDELISKFLNFITLIITEDDEKELMKRLDDDHGAFIEYDFENDIEDIAAEVNILSMNIYYTILVSIGSLASSWFNNIKDRGFKTKLEQFTSRFISPSLIANKLQTFEKRIPQLSKDHENLTIKINKITNEIKSTYLIDDQYLEVIFKIPTNYPLYNVEVTGPQRVGVKETQWKAWLLACQRIVSLQNGEISESLEFFLKNVSFHFKGFEECAICYSILHQDNSLPSKVCGTCKNKFHAGCLYKWFKSSGSSTCPLCRSTFNFK